MFVFDALLTFWSKTKTNNNLRRDFFIQLWLDDWEKMATEWTHWSDSNWALILNKKNWMEPNFTFGTVVVERCECMFQIYCCVYIYSQKKDCSWKTREREQKTMREDERERGEKRLDEVAKTRTSTDKWLTGWQWYRCEPLDQISLQPHGPPIEVAVSLEEFKFNKLIKKRILI